MYLWICSKETNSILKIIRENSTANLISKIADKVVKALSYKIGFSASLKGSQVDESSSKKFCRKAKG